MSDKPRLVVHSNAPWAPTGYGAQTALFAPKLAERYDLALSAFYGLEGSRLNWNGIPTFPGFGGSYGNEVIEGHCRSHFGGDLRGGTVLTLMDVWVLNPDLWRKFNTACWVPIDHSPAPPKVLEFLEGSGAVPIAMSKFGQAMLQGLDPLYCPHGVDTEAFQPRDREKARQATGLPEDAFVVGVVAANKGNPPRKSWTEILQAFSVLRQRHENAVLFLHTDVSGRFDGIPIPPLVRALGLPTESVRYTDQYRLLCNPIPAEVMSYVYSSFDVLLNPARGEGFGIPVLEAQACGVPVIVSDFSAMRELGKVGWRVGVEPEWTIQGSWMCRPNLGEIVEALEHAYGLPDATREEMSRDAREFALEYDADLVFRKYMVPALNAAEKRFKKNARKRDPAHRIKSGKRPKAKRSVAIVTPWFNHPELAPAYWQAVDGEDAEVIVVDNGSDPPVHRAAVRLEENFGFSHACNQGLEHAEADAVLFLNNDIALGEKGWLEPIRAALKPGVLVGAQLREDAHGQVDGQPLPYLDGWCLAGMREDLVRLGGWDEEYEEPSYYGDNDLCWRARRAGLRLVAVDVPLRHLLNATAKDMDVSEVTRRNYERFCARVRESQQVAA